MKQKKPVEEINECFEQLEKTDHHFESLSLLHAKDPENKKSVRVFLDYFLSPTVPSSKQISVCHFNEYEWVPQGKSTEIVDSIAKRNSRFPWELTLRKWYCSSTYSSVRMTQIGYLAQYLYDIGSLMKKYERKN
ncbi:hypothetical protein CVS40_7187 [Lucilia cuprina]|nr:hypothetical protein CVS40_7187 [Lucilia cuprina]